ncbi:ABC transporter permease subunit [Oenococcus sp. UCMA 14587]|nr:ABC transporter permease subunit [Oenococcus sp. UCMA 14587]
MSQKNSHQMSKISEQINAVVTITARDIILTFKSPSSIATSFMFPLIMLGMLGGGLMQSIGGNLNFNYGDYTLVGTMVNMLFMITTLGMVSLVEDRQSNFTMEMLVAPVSRYAIVIGKILGSMFAAIIGLIGTLVIGLFMKISLSWFQLLRVLILSPLMCLAAGSLTMIVIGLIKNTRTASMVASFLVLPQTFLSGVLIPLNHANGLLLILSRIMPMTYCVDLMRAFLYMGTKEYSAMVVFNPLWSLALILILTILFLIVGTFLFTKSQTNH